MNDSHRVIWIEVQLSNEQFTRVTERATQLGVTVNWWLTQAIEGALPSPMVRPTEPTKKARKRK